MACFVSNLVRRRLNEVAPPGQLRRWATFFDSLMRYLLHWGNELNWLPIIVLGIAAVAVFAMRMLTVWFYVRNAAPISQIESDDEALKEIKERFTGPRQIVPASVSGLYFLTGVALILATLWGTISTAWWVLPLGCISWFIIHAPFRDVMESWSSFQRAMNISEDADTLMRGGLTPEQERALRKRMRLP